MNHQTYTALIKPIPPSVNLANIETILPATPCSRCALLRPPHKAVTPSPSAGGTEPKPAPASISAAAPTLFSLIDHYPSFPILKASGKTCAVCKWLRKTILSQWAIRPMEEWGVGALREGDAEWHDLLTAPWNGEVRIGKPEWAVDPVSGIATSFFLEFGPQTTVGRGEEGEEISYGEIGQVLGFKVFDSRDMTMGPEDQRRRLPTAETLSARNLRLIECLIHDCENSHPKCWPADPEAKGWLPTRLLDVAPEDPRLIDSATEDLSGLETKYVALSHMWGSPTQAPPLRTLTSNLNQMRLGIEMWRLPKNFAQAVEVTRQLGLRYVWIDSLCIIQDSGADWQSEAKTMHQVYQSAAVTVVATSATCSHDGFLHRDLSMVPAVKYAYHPPETPGKPESIILSPHTNLDSGTWIGDIESTPWNHRGWTMQERCLSTRLLHFSQNKLYFECRSRRWSEESEPLEERTRIFKMWPNDADAMHGGEIGGLTREGQDEMYFRWRRAVTEYSQRGLTKGSDKLIAIASVAAKMTSTVNRNALGDEYITFAGMWKQRLRVDLLWHVKDGLVSTPWDSRAPSWSWAALDANVGWHETQIKPRAEHAGLKESALEVAEAFNGHKNVLKLKGTVAAISAIRECDSDDRWANGKRANLPHDVFGSAKTSSIMALNEPRDEVKFLEGRLDLDDNDALTKSSRTLGYVHIRSTNSSYRPSGLILERVDAPANVWKRVGVATAFDIMGNLLNEGTFNPEGEMIELLVI